MSLEQPEIRTQLLLRRFACKACKGYPDVQGSRYNVNAARIEIDWVDRKENGERRTTESHRSTLHCRHSANQVTAPALPSPLRPASLRAMCFRTPDQRRRLLRYQSRSWWRGYRMLIRSSRTCRGRVCDLLGIGSEEGKSAMSRNDFSL